MRPKPLANPLCGSFGQGIANIAAGFFQGMLAGHNDLDQYQEVVLVWWRYTLNDEVGAGRKAMRILDRHPWSTQYAIP